jgi:CBS domain containing-hemolysin-like protein
MASVLLVAAATILASFFCSLCEAALYSITPPQIELLRKRRVFGADRLARLRSNIEESIAAMLTVNTIANTGGASWCGALVGKYFGDVYVGICAGVLTLTILIFAEILPKSLGVRFSATLAPLLAWPLQVQIWLVWPVSQIGRLITRLLIGRREKSGPSEDEILVMARMAAQHGGILPQETRWIENALQLDKVRAHEIMTPRTVVYTLPANLPLSRVRQHSEHWVHSRLPLTEDREPDHIVGMVYRREVFDALVRGERDRTLRDLMHRLDFVPDTMRGHQLLDKFIKEKKHMVAVVDEYGGFEGVVTLEDVLECLIGSEIVDEHDRHPDMQLLARQRAQQRAAAISSEVQIEHKS